MFYYSVTGRSAGKFHAPLHLRCLYAPVLAKQNRSVDWPAG